MFLTFDTRWRIDFRSMHTNFDEHQLIEIQNGLELPHCADEI